VDVYNKDGEFLRTAIWECDDADYGPRVDAQGNIYMAMRVLPERGYVPPLWSQSEVSDAFKQQCLAMYGSIVKFSPAGGALWLTQDYEKEFGFDPPKLDLKTEQVTVGDNRHRKAFLSGALQGALWWKPGFSSTINMTGGGDCHCNGMAFDTDLFGRTFYPDRLGFRVVVVDTNGNEITDFGSYGNHDQRGPFSWVRDPKTGALRPPREDDPKQLKSPFAEPEITFGYLAAVAVGEKHVYTGDSLNGRIGRVRMDYEADETCEVGLPQ
jgi:hypothetical protein